VTSSRGTIVEERERAGGDPLRAEPGREVPMFPVAARAADILAMLESLEPADLSPADLVEVVAACGQVLAMVSAVQARAVAEVSERRAPLAGDFALDEIACALVTTRAAVQLMAGRGAGLVNLPVLADALSAGRIDARKVDIILEGTLVLAHRPERAALVAEAVEQATGLTGPQLARWLRRRVIEIDPESATKRARAARAERGVELKCGEDAMAWITAYLPAADAIAAYTAIDALAAAAKDAGDQRTVDQRRADAFADVFTGILDAERTPGGEPLPRKRGQRLAVNLTMAATTMLGLDEQPAEIAGYGPIPAALARQVAQDGTWRRIFTDPLTGSFLARGRRAYRPGADLTATVVARDATCTFPGCRQPAWRGEIDHIVPFDRSRPADEQTTEENLHALCKRHHQAKTLKLWNVSRDKATGNTLWTSPLGVTYSRSPIPVYVAPTAYDHAAARAKARARADEEMPPF